MDKNIIEMNHGNKIPGKTAGMNGCFIFQKDGSLELNLKISPENASRVMEIFRIDEDLPGWGGERAADDAVINSVRELNDIFDVQMDIDRENKAPGTKTRGCSQIDGDFDLPDLSACECMELDEKLQELNQFFYKINRDLRAALNKINGYLAIISQSPHLFPKILPRIMNQSAFLLNNFDELIVLSNASILSDFTAIDIKDLIRQTFLTNKPESAVIDFTIDCNLDEVRGDKEKLEQVFVNILKNSIKFRDPGKEKLELTVKCCRSARYAVIQFEDNGIGIDPKNIDKVFSLSYSSLMEEGTGLGLPISRKIVEAHGGRVGIESAGEGKGTKVTVKLPV